MSNLCLTQLSREAYLPIFILNAFTFHQLQAIILQIHLWNLDQLHIACDAAIIPPVENQCRHSVGMTLIIHLHNHRILALHKQIADVVVKSRKAAYVVTRLLAVYPHVAVVVHGTEIQQRLIILHRHSLETLLEPHGSLVEEETLVLRVPVRRYLHDVRLIKIILNQVLRALRLRIDEEAVTHGIHTVVVIALLLHVDDVIPLTIQRHRLIRHHILDYRQFFDLSRCRQHPAQGHANSSQ